MIPDSIIPHFMSNVNTYLQKKSHYTHNLYATQKNTKYKFCIIITSFTKKVKHFYAIFVKFDEFSIIFFQLHNADEIFMIYCPL